MGFGDKFKLSSLNTEVKNLADKIPVHSAPAELVEKQAAAWITYLDAPANQRGFNPPSSTIGGKSYNNLVPRDFMRKAVENKQAGVVLRHLVSNGSKDIERAVASKYLQQAGMADDCKFADQLQHVPSDIKAMALHLWMVGSDRKFGANDKDFSFRKVEQKINPNEDTLSLAQKGFAALDQSVMASGVQSALNFRSLAPKLQFLEREPALQPFLNRWRQPAIGSLPAPPTPVPAAFKSAMPQRKAVG